jgi:hypothetical protein
MKEQGQPITGSCRPSEVYLHITHAFASRQIITWGGRYVTDTHCFYPHAAAFALSRWVNASLSAGRAVIARTSILASLIGFSAALTANFDMLGPPSDMGALVPAQDAAPAWAPIVTL